MKALVLIAHPDDELLFLGAHILNHPDWDWRIICMTHELDDWRGREFLASQAALSAAGVTLTRFTMLGMADEDVPEGDFARWDDAFRRHLDAFPADDVETVYSHNRVGEYGHPHHIACCVIARRYFACPVSEFWHPNFTGEQLWRGNHLGIEVSAVKQEVFQQAYGGHWATLRAHQPQLMAFLLDAGIDMVTR